MSVDILGTSRDQCVSMVQYCFTSTETIRLVRTDSPGRPPRLSHSSWTMKAGTSTETTRLISGPGPQLKYPPAPSTEEDRLRHVGGPSPVVEGGLATYLAASKPRPNVYYNTPSTHPPQTSSLYNCRVFAATLNLLMRRRSRRVIHLSVGRRGKAPKSKQIVDVPDCLSV